MPVFYLSWLRWVCLVLLVFSVSGCSLSQASQLIPVSGDQASPAVVKETVLVVVTSTPQPATPTLPSATPAASETPLPTRVTSIPPTPARTLAPSPTPLSLVNVPIEGGLKNVDITARLVFPNYQPAAFYNLWFRVYAWSPKSSNKDGNGIESVDFVIKNSKGEQVHHRTEKNAGYCAFGGGEPDCNIWDFFTNHYTWPDGGKIVSDTYTIFINVNTKNGLNCNGSAKFKIQVP